MTVATDPIGHEKFVTSAGLLRHMLNAINEATWNAEPEQIKRWLQRGLIGWGASQQVGRLIEGDLEIEEEAIDDSIDRVEHNAQYAFACFSEMCAFSEAHEVPIVVDQ